MQYIIGSSAAGVAAASALLERGVEVTMLDAGLELEPERAAAIGRMRATDKQHWDAEAIRILKENTRAGIGGVEHKYIFGSDYPFREMDIMRPVKSDGAKMYRSLARGGLTNIWGGSILPYRANDIVDWPISLSDLEPHYRAALSMIEHAGFNDGLDAMYPQYGVIGRPHRLSRQAMSFMDDLDLHRALLDLEGIHIGRSRLAVRFPGENGETGCVYCGMCLYGCPYDYIYSTRHTLAELLRHENFHYRSGVFVEKVVEENGVVKIMGRTLDSRERLEFCGSRCFLAAGVLSSTAILLSSLEAYDHPIRIKHSEHFQLPLLRYARTRGAMSEELHTLAQLYMEVDDPLISRNTVHLQVYTYNDLYRDAARSLLGPLVDIFGAPLSLLLERMLFIQGFLHSDISSSIEVRLGRSGNGSLVISGSRNPETKVAVQKIVSKLRRNRGLLRATPLPAMVTVSPPGGGNHSGGSFPMRQKSEAFETDTTGRPNGFEHVHVVDSTVFPSIAATTMVLTVMANARRIAAAVV